MNSDVANHIRAFGMSGFQILDELNQVSKNISLDLGHLPVPNGQEARNAIQYFEASVRAEATEMAKHYQLFYCLELSIRKLINNILTDSHGANWWDSNCVPQNIKDDVKRRRKDELDSGVTPRSDNPIDLTTFGELEIIISSNWKSFESVFDSQNAVRSIIKRLNVLRGPIAHCCPYSDDEKERLQLTVRDWVRLF